MSKQDFESASVTAERLGVTVRAVQKWAAAGKIPGAEKIGRSWFIPKGATVNEQNESGDIHLVSDKPISVAKTMPLLTGTFKLGHCLEFIDSIEDQDERNMALGQYYFYCGKTKESFEILEQYLTSSNNAFRYTAAVLCVFASISHGNMECSSRASEVIKDLLYQMRDPSLPADVQALALITLVGASVLWHAPVPDHLPSLESCLRYLPEGYRLWGCYLLAHKAYLDKDYNRAIAITDMGLAMCTCVHPVAAIYNHIIAVIALMTLRRPEEAKKRFEEAWELARPDGFIEPIAEHHGMMLGMIEVYLKRVHPADFKKVISISGVFSAGWKQIHNIKTFSEVTSELSSTEFSVAMLYSRGWSAQEIASFMELSESTVRNYIKTIYVKLGISGRKALIKYMIK